MADPKMRKDPEVEQQVARQGGVYAAYAGGVLIDFLAIGSFNKAIYSDGSTLETAGKGINGIALTIIAATLINAANQIRRQNSAE